MQGALRRLRSFARDNRWGLVAFAVVFYVYWWIWWNDDRAHRLWADGFYSFMYSRSIVYDHDIEFTNDYKLCGDPQQDIHRTFFSSHPFNGMFIGSSVYFVPAMWLARLLVRLPANASPQVLGACEGPITQWTLFVGVVLGALTLWLAYRAARRYVGDGVAAAAAVLFGLASTLPAFAAQNPCYTHTYEAFSAAVALWLSVRAEEKPDRKIRWLLAGAYCGIALLMRPNVLMVAWVPAALALFCFWGRWKELAIAWGLILAGLIVFGILPLGLCNSYILGKFSPFAARDKHQLQWGHPHEWLLLFSPIGGLFFFTPAAWFAFFGVPTGLLRYRTRAITVGFLVCTATMVFICACVLDWHGANSFGARRLTPLVPLFVVMAALFFESARRWLLARPSRAMTLLALAIVTPFCMSVSGIVSGIRAGRTNWWDHALSQEEIYGGGAATVWYWIDHDIGDLALLPAELVYAARFHLPMNTFRDACRYWYSRHTRHMYWKPNLPGLTDGKVRSLEDGMAEGDGGMKMTKDRARLVLTTEWPLTTEYTVKASSKKPARLQVGDGHAFTSVWFGAMDLPGDGKEVSQTFQVPKGELESGINEFLFDAPGAVDAGVVLRGISMDDTNPYPPMYPALRDKP